MQPTTLVLTADQHQRLEAIVRLPKSQQRLALRARIALAVASGMAIRAVARACACRPTTVRKWCRRIHERGLEGLKDQKRSGRPRRITPQERCSVISAACSLPSELGLKGHSVLSGALIAEAVLRSGAVAMISDRSVQRILHLASLKPHRCDYWKRPSDPQFEAKMRPIIDLYLNPPDDGPVWGVDEKTSIQALQRRFPDLPLRKSGELIHREAEYIRHGTRCLTAGFEIQTGKVLGIVTPNRPEPVFISFLDHLHNHVPKDQVIHVVLDNLNTHKGQGVRHWQAENPGRMVFHYLPFYASWLNQIEMWFGTLQRRCIKRGDFRSGEDLTTQILDFMETHNHLHAHPYRWTYTGDPLAA